MQENTARIGKTGHQAGRAAYHLSARVLGAGILRAWGEETHCQWHPAQGGGLWDRTREGDTRMGQEEEPAPPLCWMTEKADLSHVGRESSKK